MGAGTRVPGQTCISITRVPVQALAIRISTNRHTSGSTTGVPGTATASFLLLTHFAGMWDPNGVP
eukprot:3191505-Rhodomonas_salina.2